MTYRETLDYLYSQLPVYHRIGKAAYKADLNNSLALDRHFGHPHRCFKTVHVAGTNGKGSVSHMLSSVLQEAGYKTGLYTSPHLLDYRERIRINGIMIGEEDVVSFVKNNNALLMELKPSFFEMSVAMAFDYFAKSRVDIAIIETGLGGRLDSTNVITPILSVITNIGFDHMDLLGNSLQEIANEKAGIIKQGVPVVVGERDDVTSAVFEQVAKNNKSSLSFGSDNFTFTWESENFTKGTREFSLCNSSGEHVLKGSSPLTGDYQAKNIVTVVEAIEKLGRIINITRESISQGITSVTRNTGLMGRWQVLQENPVIICDTGHNGHGLKYVTQQLVKNSKGKLHIVCGFVNDKSLDLVLPLFPSGQHYYYTKASVSRALDENQLADQAKGFGLKGQAYNCVRTAVEAAIANAGSDDIVFIGGSTFVVADALQYLKGT